MSDGLGSAGSLEAMRERVKLEAEEPDDVLAILVSEAAHEVRVGEYRRAKRLLSDEVLEHQRAIGL